MGEVTELHPQGGGFTAPAPLDNSHNFADFDCGKEALNDWLKKHATKQEARSARTFVVTRNGVVVGYYCLAAGGVLFDDAPRSVRRNMPNPVPVMVIGRLAVQKDLQFGGIGSGLLKDALLRILTVAKDVGVRAVVVHAVDEDAVAFYVKHQFQAFPQESLTLFLPIETIAKALGA